MMFCLEKMRRLFHWFYSHIRKKRRLELALVGLDNSGKTTFANFIEIGRFKEHSMSTIGFHFKKVVRSKCIIKICDLGGLPRFRSIWSRYCTGMDAIIFMLDAQNQTQFEQSKWELEQLMSSTRLEGIPLLVLANKMDNDEGNAPTIGMQELAEQLDFVKIGNERAVGCIPISCKEGRNIDVALQWLLKYARE